MMNNYCCTEFKRGTGLGNKLFPWARCIVFAQQNQIPMLMPNWFHFRKGSLFKGGINYKMALGKILLYNNFENYGQYVTGLQKLKITLTQTKADGDSVIFNKKNHFLYEFSGDKKFFTGLHDHHSLIKSTLEHDVHHSLKKWIDTTEVPPIVLNIRRGKDFKDADIAEDFIFKGALRTPLKWFIETLNQIRKNLNEDIPALIISDGTEDDLKDILALPKVKLSKSPSAITDLLLLSKAKVILGSGGSSFSAWGSFLSKAITLTITGQSLQWFNVTDDLDKHVVITYDYLYPDQNLLDQISIKLKNK